MQEKARVVAIDGDLVSVVPLEIVPASTATTPSASKTETYSGQRTKGFTLRVGSQVRIGASAGKQVWQAS
jgi:hypothetical protein